MDWANETWVKLYTRTTVDDTLLSWEATALWDAIFKRLDRSGVLAFGRHGWRGVSAVVGIPVEVVERVVPELLADGRIVEREGCIVSPNYVEAQATRSSDAQRQRDSREKRRAAMLAETVTDCDQQGDIPSQSVTNSHRPSPPVTPCHDKNRVEESREEKNSSRPPAEVTKEMIEYSYRHYPMKKGKAKGVVAALKILKTEKQLHKFNDCIAYMAFVFADDNTYCPHFSTFVNGRLWEDDEWPSPGKSQTQGTGRAPERIL